MRGCHESESLSELLTPRSQSINRLPQEIDMECQQVLWLRHGQDGNCHLVSDLYSRFAELQSHPNPSAIISSLDVQHAAECLQRMTVSDYAPCRFHNSMCYVGGPLDLDCTGSPCQDYSAMGARGGMWGKHFPVLKAWLQWVLHRQPSVAPCSAVQHGYLSMTD